MTKKIQYTKPKLLSLSGLEQGQAALCVDGSQATTPAPTKNCTTGNSYSMEADCDTHGAVAGPEAAGVSCGNGIWAGTIPGGGCADGSYAGDEYPPTDCVAGPSAPQL